MELLAYGLAILIGVSLGLIGSGGSILTVPILVYLLQIDPVIATSYSLFIVGVSAFVGGLKKSLEGFVDYKMVLFFGIPSIFVVLFTRSFIVPHIPAVLFAGTWYAMSKGTFIMLVFALIMIFAAISMIRNRKEDEFEPVVNFKLSTIFFRGISLGLVTGLVGAGGGFLIIPTLVISAKMKIKKAIGTSLFIVAFNSLVGFLGYREIDDHPIQWRLLLFFSLASILGIFVGSFFAKRMEGEKLKTGFGCFVLVIGIYILVQELGLFK